MDEQMIADLVEATEEVFETMVCRAIEPGVPLNGLALDTAATVVATVAFAGEWSGLVAFHSATHSARAIAGAMLGIAAHEVDGEMPDAMGEVANMIAGGFRMRLKSRGTDVAISIPTVITGTDFHTRYVTRVSRVLCPFRLEDGATVFVELIVNQ